MSDGRCTGHCCRRFPLSQSYAEVKEAAEKVKAGGHDRFQDSVFVADMLVPLGLQVANGSGEMREFFTCRHLDASTGDCGVYEQRPTLCREHPFYGRSEGTCHTPGCTLDHEPGRQELLNIRKATEAASPIPALKESEP